MKKKKPSKKKASNPQTEFRSIHLSDAKSPVRLGRPPEKHMALAERINNLREEGEGIEIPLGYGGTDLTGLAEDDLADERQKLAMVLHGVIRRQYIQEPPKGLRHTVRVLSNGNVGIFLVQKKNQK